MTSAVDLPAGLLRGGRLYMGGGWLRLLELDPATSCRYLVERDAVGAVRACCPTYRWTGTSTPLTRYHESHLTLLRGLAPADVDPSTYFPTLLVGPPGGRDNELVAPGAGAPAGRAVLEL